LKYGAANPQIFREERPRLILDYPRHRIAPAEAALKIDWKRELTLNLALLGSLITLIGGMALVIRISVGKW
jgi:hypothetical protein